MQEELKKQNLILKELTFSYEANEKNLVENLNIRKDEK